MDNKREIYNFVMQYIVSHIDENYHAYNFDEMDDTRDEPARIESIVSKLADEKLINLIADSINFNVENLSKDVIDEMFSNRQDFLNNYMDSDWLDYEINESLNENILDEYPELKRKVKIDKSKKSQPISTLVKELQGNYNLCDEQFRISHHNRIGILSIRDISEFTSNSAHIMIANRSFKTPSGEMIRSLHILDIICANYGYERVMTAPKWSHGKQIWSVVYHPVNPLSATDIVIGKDYIYHFSSVKNRESITEKGILPGHGGRNYVYDDKRSYFYIRSDYRNNQRFYHMLNGIGRLNFKRDKNPKDFLFDNYRISTMFDKNVSFFWDPNEDDCVYTNSVIEPKYIELVGELDVSDREHPTYKRYK